MQALETHVPGAEFQSTSDKHVTMVKLLYSSRPQFPHLKKEGSDSTLLLRFKGASHYT